MKSLKKILSVLTLIVLVGSDFLTSFSYALEDMLEDSVVVQTENEEETLERESMDEEGIDYEEVAENEEDEEMVAENDSAEELTGMEVDLENDEDLGIDEETSEDLTGTEVDLENTEENILSDKQEEELEGTGVELSKAWETLNDAKIEKSEQYNSVTVSVSAKEGTFPKGTDVVIEPIKSDYQLDEIREQINESDVSDNISQNAEIVAFDIKFEYELSDGSKVELQPLLGESVQVTFDYSDNQIFKKADKNKNQEIEIYHINDKNENGEIVEKGEETVEKMDINQKESEKVDNALVIDAESFSIYVVTYGNENPEFYALLAGDDSARNNFHYKTITISDGTHTYTLMDRNLGARVAWDPEVNEFLNSNTGNYETESDYYGYYYQWGNSYGFSTNTTTINNKKGVIKLNAIPSNYVSSTWSNPWTPYYNEGYFPLELSYNLRGDTTNTESARQGPCPRGWHVPSANEWESIHNAWCISDGKEDGCTASEEFAKALQMPTAGYRMYSACLNPPCIKFYSCGNVGAYRSSTLNYLSYSPNQTGSKANSLHFNWNDINSNNSLYETNRGLSVRCLKNKTDAVTLYLNPNSGSVENGIIDADSQGKVTLPTATRNEYNFDGWYDAADGGNRIGGSGDEITINKDTDLYAKWVIKCEDGEIYSSELGECVARWHELVSLTDDTTTTTVGSNDPVEGLPTTITVIENDILDSLEGEELSEIEEIEGKELVGDITIDFGGNAIFSHLVQVKIPVTGSSKAYVKVKHVGSSGYNFDGLTRNIEASCVDGDIENSNDMYDGAYIDVESGYVSIYTCEASNFAAIGLPKVTFEPENGSGAIVVEVESGATVNSGDIPTVTKDGYTFSGWYLTGAESAFDFSGTAITGDITLYARWEQEGVTYTVTFDANRGTFANLPTPQSVASGSLISAPTQQQTPELPGYTFTGWWTEPGGGTKWDFANDPVTGNITLYAHWAYNYTFGDLDVYMIDSSGSLIKYVMMDRNMGATGVYNKDFDNQNHNSFGFVYQWGNNYGFPRCSSTGTCNYSLVTGTQVSVDIVENYIPSKFASSTWIGKKGSNASTKTWHFNSGNVLKYLWGNGNNIDMQGPCPDGYHVPLASETNNQGGLFMVWGNIYDKIINTNGSKGSGFVFLSDDQELFTFQFLLPHAGAHKKGNTNEQEINMCGDYWTTTPSGLESARNMWFCKDGDNQYYDEYGNFLFINASQRNNGSTVRCFKNSTGSANLDIVNGGKKGLITVEKVGGVATINAIKEPENTDVSGTDLKFGGWYTSPTFESNTMKTGGDILSDSVTALYAKWDCPEGLAYNTDNQCVSGVLIRFMDGETEYTRSVVLSGLEVTPPADPEKSGYNFLGWFAEGAESVFVFSGTHITGNLDLYAHWDINNYDVNVGVATGDEDKGYLSGMGSTGISLTGLYDYGTELVFIAIPELGYVFDYWMNGDQVLSGTDLGDGKNQLTIVVDQVLNIIAFFKSVDDTPTPYTVEHYQQNLAQTGYDFVWSGIMYGTANAQTNATGTNYEGFTLSGNLSNYQTGIKADGSTVVRLYYNRDVYTVTFENWNGDFLWSGKVANGEIPTYGGSTPTRASTQQSVYTFDGWYPELSPVTGDTTYTATYTESPRLYTVTLTGTPAGYGTLSPESLSGEYETAIVISGSQLTIGGTEVILTGNEGYEFQEWTGTCGQMAKQVCDEFIVYSHPDPIEFTGGNNIVINSEGHDLFSQSGFQKDFEISFDILSLNLSGSPKQATLLSVKNEDLNNVWPGLSFRRETTTSNLELTIRGGSVGPVAKAYNGSDVHSVKISRENGKLYIAINGGNKEKVYDFAGFTNYFDKPITIGSIYQNGGYDRYIKGTLSNILIKTIDTSSCSSGLVLAVTGDCQMTAVFQELGEKNTVRFIDGESVYATGIVLSGEEVTPPVDPEKSGYNFVGWFAEGAESAFVFSGTPITGDLDLYAHWSTGNSKFTINCYVWNLDPSHNQLIDTTHLTGIEHTGTTNNSISIQEYSWSDCLWISGYNEGYQLSGAIVYGSDLSGGVETGWLGTTTILADGTRIIDMYIVPKQNNYSVIPTENCGSKGSLDGTYYYGSKINLEASPYECYSFSGWIGDNLPNTFDKTSAIAEFDMPNNYVIATPTVRENTYNIIFSGNGSTSGFMSPLSVHCTTGTLSQNNFEREGYTFTGWSTTSTGSVQFSNGADVHRLSTENGGSVTLYAVWDINEYEIDASVATGDEDKGYLSGMGSVGINLTGLYDYATELVFIAIPELGYVFDYWKNGDTVLSGTDLGDGTNQLTVVVDQILDIIAFFRLAEYDVNIASNNTGYGTVSTGSVTKPYGTPITDNGNGTLTIDDVTVTATTGTAPAGYTYTFSGWTFSSECESGGNYVVAEGCTITGNFEGTLNTYTVTFDLSGGSLTGDMTLTKNYTIETPAISLSGYVPERNGYTFTGWYRDGILVDSIAGGETGDYTLVARWEAQERPIPVVVFMKMLVPGVYTEYDSQLMWGWGTVGELYTAPLDEFTPTGFYYEEDNESNVRSVIVSPNVDNEVHLYFSRIPYPLIITNAGEGISYEATGGGDHLYEEPVTINITPYTGWEFLNWTIIQGTLSGVNDLTQRTLSFNMPAEQVRLSPNLNHIEYTLSFDSASGTAVANQTYYYNDLLSGLDNAITTKTGYDFAGWYLSGVLYTSGSTMPAENITLTAVWDINEYEVNASVATGDEDKGYLSGMGSTGISLTGLYDYATELVFIAIPELGYVFDYWKNGDTVLSGTDLGDGINQLTVVVDQVLDIIAFFKPADDTPYTVEHYQANVELNGYDFVWSGIMYGTTNELTNATGTDYEGFSLHNGDISEYQTGIKADGSTVVRLYYDRNRYIVTWNTWNGHEVTKTDVAYGQHPYFYLTPPERDVLDPEDEDYDFTFTGWTRSGVSGIVDLETEIVTGDITYTAEYDRSFKYYTVKYYPNGGTGIMLDQTNLQLHTSGNLTKNNFTRTGYIFSGWYSSMGLRYEDEQEINMGRADGFEYDLSGNFFLSLEAQWEPKTDTKVTVNYYLKNLDVENNVLTGGSREYLIGVEFTGVTDDIVDIFAKYGTGIEGYEYSTSIVYGPDFPGGVETGTTTILADGSREIDMYYVPKKYNFTLNTAQYSSTAGSSESTGYYYGSKVTLSGASNDDCFTRSGWLTTGITLSDNTLNQTWFTMPANDVEVTPTVKENTYNIIFNGNESTSGSMSPMNGVRCTESTGLTLNAFEKSGHTFTGWSTTSAGTKEYTDGQTVGELSKVDGDDVTLYAVWDINEYEIDANVAIGDHGYLSGMGSVGISLTGLYDFGETLVVIAIPELGYLFDYWEVNGSQELPEGVTTSGNQLTAVVDQILDIVAHFKENVGTVTVNYYEMNTGGTYSGVTSTSTFTGLVGYTGYATLNPSYGFHLDIERTANTGIVISDNDAENVMDIYYARDKNHVIILYTGDFEGETMSFGSTVVVNPVLRERYYYGEHIYFEAIPNTGYVFKSWTYSGDRQETVTTNQREISFDMGTGEVRLTLDGDIINYYIYYDLDGGIENPERPKNRTGYTVRDYSFEVYNPIKTGYIFLGWTGGINGTGISTPVSGLIVNVASGVGDMSYHANWTGMEYVVTVYVEPENGGTVHGTGVYHYGDPISLLATPNVDSGYQFTGWYAGYNKISDYYSYGFQADDSGGTGLTAKFELKTYQVCVSADYYRGSQYPSSGCYPYQHGSIVTVNAWPYEGYKVRNWMVNDWERKIGDNQTYTGDNLDLTVNGDTNVFINFEPIKYNIVYMSGDTILTGLYPSEYDIETSICDENYSYEYGGCMYYLPTLTKDGYDFTGWYNSPRVSSYDRIKVLSGVGDKTIYAGWLVHDYNITYHLGSGESFSGAFYPYEYESYNIETPRTALPQAQKSGYVFSGWVDYNGKSFTGFGGGMTGDLDLYTTWRPDVMDITVNYYEMNTGGQYYPSSWTYYKTYYYTGFTNSGFTAPDYTTTGFRLDGNMHPSGNPSIVISGNENANIIDVYYEREKYSLETLWPTSRADMTITPSPIEYNSYYFGTEINITIAEHTGYRFTGWYQEEGMEFPSDEVMDLTSKNITFHMPAHNVKVFPEMEHIEYILTFTGYEGTEVVNQEYIHVTLTGENHEWYDTELVLPDLNKSGYNFLGWFSGEAYVWSTYYLWQDHYPTWHMPAHDIELRAEFTGRTDMYYNRYYYLQDTEGTGYTLSGDLTDFEHDGVTNQEIPGRFGQKYITGFEYTGFGYSGEAMLPREQWPIIKATGENYVDLYYDRKVDSVYVEYDANKMSVTGTGEYRYGAPVTLTATVKTGYEFSGFALYQGGLLTTGSVYNFTMPDGYVYLYANADPIVYSIDYELYGGYRYPYGWVKTGYTVESDVDIFDLVKEGYTFLGWTGGEIGVWELTEPTTGLWIYSGSVGDRKYFANWEPAEVNVTVNYYTKSIDPELNILTGGVELYKKSVIYTGLTDDVVNISEAYGTGIEGYSYTTAIVYGPDLSGGVETGTTTVLSGRSIDIYYTPIKYDFTVVAGPNTTTSGTSISTGYYYGAYVTLSGDSTDDCFEWDKWGTATLPEGKNQQHTTFDMPAHNVTVESMVAEKSYNIKFDANGGSGTMGILPVQCTSGTLIANSFERDGYTFTGWSRNVEGPVEFTGGADIYRLSTESGGSVTLFAIWDANWYTVTFDLSGGSLTGDMTLTKEYTIETPTISLTDYIPERTGYTFTGWYRGDNLVNSIAGGETGDYTLTAKWEANDVFLHISYLGKMLTGEYYYIMSEAGDYPKVGSFYEAEIIDFSGFTYDPTEPKNRTGMIVSWNSGQNDIQIYYKRDQYPLIINYDDTISEISGAKEIFYYEEPATITINPFTGWEFVGWTKIQGDLSGVDLSQQTLSFNMPAGQVQISPILNHILYTVSFDAASGTAVEESQTYYYNDNLSGLDNAVTTRTGYDFDGWYLSGVLYTSESTMPAEDITLTAKWTPRTGIQYQVNHRGENIEGTAYDVELSGYIMYGTSDSQTIAESGNFAGFTLSGNVDQKIINPNGTTVIDIYYDRNVYTISLNNNGGTGVTEITGKYEAPVTVQEPTRLGYNFAGWDPNIPSTMPLSGWSATAKWNAGLTQYTVNYHIEKVQTGEYDIYTGVYTGETDSSPWIPLYPYSLTGFIKPNQFTGKIIPEGAEFDYYYYRNSYMLYYDTAGGTPLSGILFRYGEKILTGETERPGYTLITWNNIPEDGNMPAQSGLTLVALREPNAHTKYTVYHLFENLSGGYTTGDFENLSGTTDTLTAAAPKHVPGYESHFDIGDASHTGDQVNIDGDGNAHVEIYYDRIVYQIDFDMSGGDAIEGTGVKFGTYIKSFIDSLNPHKQGYAFSGWNPEFPTTMPDHNLTGIAMWRPTTGEYKVEFYYQLADGKYPGTATSGEFRTGNTEWTGRVTDSDKQPAISGYTFDSTNTGNVLEGEIVGDGSLILKVYFKKQFTVRYLTGSHGTFSEDIHTDLDYGIETPAFRGNTGSHDSGYTFIGWSPELAEIVTGDIDYAAQWVADSDTLYSVEYHKQNLSGGYDVWTGIYTGETDVNVTALVKSFTGFTYSGGNQNNVTSGVIAGDGSLVLKLFYDRNKYTITWKDGNNETLKTEELFYEATPAYSGATPSKTRTAQYTYTFNDTWSPNIESVTTGATYVAQFDASINSYTINIESNDTDMGTINTGVINVEYGAVIVESGNKITIGGVEIEATPNPADAQYTYEFDSWTNTCGSELVGTCTIQAKFKKTLNKYTITWRNEDGSLIDTTLVAYGTVPTHVNPTKADTEYYTYTFVGWTPNVVAVVGDAEYTAVFTEHEKQKPSGGGNNSSGRGRISNINNSDNQHGSAEENPDLTTGDVDNNISNMDKEILSLYEWARQNDITTMDTVEEANPDGYVTRGHMAKMVVNFVENVLGKPIPTTYPDKCNWNDKESERESQEIKIYAKKACSLGLMGIYVDEFMPNKILDRAEFGTIVSRLLWGDRYNITDTDHRSYYEDHLYALKKQGILTQISNPEARWEIRKWVWLVFRRIEEKLKN